MSINFHFGLEKLKLGEQLEFGEAGKSPGFNILKSEESTGIFAMEVGTRDGGDEMAITPCHHRSRVLEIHDG